MNTQYRKVFLAGAWMSIVVAVVLAGDATSLNARLVLASFGLVPALVAMRLWNAPPQTISQPLTRTRR